MRTLVPYVFHIINERVHHFIKNAVFFDPNIDFLFIACDKNITRQEINLPEYCKFMTRENLGYDFGAWSDALLINNLYKNYTHFIFVNSSVVGPFLPSNFKGKWTDIFLLGLKDNVKLFGVTINSMGDPLHGSHIQSYLFSMKLETLEYLVSCNIFTMKYYPNTQYEAICEYEIAMSRRIIDKGWNIGCLMNYYKDVDFTFKENSVFDYNYFLKDLMYPPYKDRIWNKYELVFIKGNRIKDY